MHISGDITYQSNQSQTLRPTHLLAKYAQGIDDFSVWLEEDPCFIVQALLQDVNNVFMV